MVPFRYVCLIISHIPFDICLLMLLFGLQSYLSALRISFMPSNVKILPCFDLLSRLVFFYTSNAMPLGCAFW